MLAEPALGDAGTLTTMIEFERVACNLCGSDDGRVLLRGVDKNSGVPGTFQLVRCNVCGLVYQNPRPTRETLSACYPDDYGPHQVERVTPPISNSGWAQRKQKIARELADYFFLPPAARSRRLPRLEVLPFYIYLRTVGFVFMPNAPTAGWPRPDGGSSTPTVRWCARGWSATRVPAFACPGRDEQPAVALDLRLECAR